MADVMVPPVKVAPHIRFFRWGLLGAGIMYGMFHQSRLTRKEAAIREVEQQHKAVRDAKIAQEKKLASEREIKELEALAGVKS